MLRCVDVSSYARVELVAGEREALESLRKRQRSARSLAFSAGIILGCAMGVTDKEVAKQARTTSWTVGFWRKAFQPRPAGSLV